MKKQILIFLLTLLPMMVNADDSGLCGDNVTYTYVESTHTLTISGTGAMTNYTSKNTPWYIYSSEIVKAIIEDGVTNIGNYAFEDCSNLASITIPNSVTSIGNDAFRWCRKLISITIPNSVTSIGDNAFGNCYGLSSITIPNSVTSIGVYAFGNCYGLSSITIPNSVTSIEEHAFWACRGLTSVTIPNSVTSIGRHAFGYCTDLTSINVEEGNTKYDSRENCNAIIEKSSNSLIAGCKKSTIPNSVTSIGYGAFIGCTGLTSITIPNSVTSIGVYAFNGCTGLSSITIPNSVTSIRDSAFLNTGWYKNQSDGILYLDNWLLGYKGEAPTGQITISEGTKGIAGNAFYSCSGLTSVTIPNSVTTIGGGAFYECTSLTSITIGSGITNIDNSAFSKCPELTDVTCMAESVPSTGNGAFADSPINNATLHVPGTAIDAYKTTSPWSNFGKFVTLTEEEIANPVEIDGIWYNLVSKSKIAEVTKKPSGYYSGAIVIPERVTYNGTEYSVTNIGDKAFQDCSGLTSVTIPNSVTNIGDKAFQDCSGLTSVTIPNSVTSIGSSTFYRCTGLTSVTIPNSVTSIGEFAFADCTGLTSVTIPNSVTSIGSRAFLNCSGLTSVHISDLEAWCKISFDGLTANPLYYVHHLFMNGSEITNLVIPNSVTSIGRYAFEDCSGLTSVTIPNSVTTIGDYAFYKCSGMTTLTITNSVTSIGNWAFADCTSLKSVSIPNGVTTIGDQCFWGCSSLTSITIPNSVTSIGDNAFRNCDIPEVISLIENPFNISTSTFTNNTYYHATLYVPVGTIEKYKATEGWKKFSKIVEGESETSDNITFADPEVKRICVANWDTNGDGELSKAEAAAVKDIGKAFQSSKIKYFDEFQHFSGVKQIDHDSFGSCSDLVSIVLPEGLETLGQNAFIFCGKLASITLPPSLKTICIGGFWSCSKLTSLTIPKSVTSIAEPIVGYQGGLAGNSGVISIKVEDGNPVYDSRNGCNAIIETSSNKLIVGCKSTIIPNTVKTIGSCAFECCNGLTEISIPTSVKTIEYDAFSRCYDLKKIHIPSSVTSIGDQVFVNCGAVEQVTVDSSNPIYDSRDNCNAIIGTKTNTLIRGCGNTTIPNSVTRIEYRAFYGCSNLTSITIPNSVTIIGDWAFYDCYRLTSVTIGSGINKIWNAAFKYCPQLVNVYCHAEQVPSTAGDAFDNSNIENCTLHVPAASVEAYKAAAPWNRFKEIVSLPVPEAVDLGVSVKWATFNLGADSEVHAGDYFSWADTVPTQTFSKEANTFYNEANPEGAKLDVNSLELNGTQLPMKFDAANSQWGGRWRLPSKNEWNELINSCDWVWKGNGYRIYKKGSTKDSESIFLPTTGFKSTSSADVTQTFSSTTCQYWSGDINGYYAAKGQEAMCFKGDGDFERVVSAYREFGLCIRPVTDPAKIPVKIESIDSTNVSFTTADIVVTLTGGLEDASLVGIAYGTSANGLTPSDVADDSHKISKDVSGTVTFQFTNLQMHTKYYAMVYVKTSDGYVKSGVFSFTTLARFPVAEAVDLDLPSGIKWASWNMGSSSPLDIPSDGTTLFGWGDPNGDVRSLAIGDNPYYKDCDVDDKSVNIAGTKYDIATVQWGKGWQLPTTVQFKELIANCNMQDATFTDERGNTYRAYKIISKKNPNKFIYLPMAGLRTSRGEYRQVGNGCYYWTAINNGAGSANYVVPSQGSVSEDHLLYVCLLAIRPVWVEDVTPTYTLSITSTGNGSVSYEGTYIRNNTRIFTVDEGTSATITFKPDNGYQLRSVKVGGTDVTSSIKNSQYTINNISKSTTVNVEFTASIKFPVADAVDLDLPSGIKWASWNMGSSSPLDVPSDGSTLFGWGDPNGDVRSLSLSDNPYFKDCNYDDNQTVNIAGSKYDIATVQWGKGWQLPTLEQFKELINFCNMQEAQYTDYTGKTYVAYKISSKKDDSKYIYLPKAGMRNTKGEFKQVGNSCYYWTSNNVSAGYAVYAMPTQGSANESHLMYSSLLAIRPIYDKNATGDGTGEPVVEPVTPTQKDISKATITVNDSYTYTGQAIQPEFIVQYEGAVLTRGTDYTVTVTQNVNAGTATITVTGKDNYTGTAVKNFTIKPAVLTVTADDKTKVYLEPVPDLTYKFWGFVGSETESVLTKKPEAATEANRMSPVGKYEITFNGAEARNYVFTYVSGTLTVTPKDLSIAILTLQDDSCVYTGKAIMPVPTVTLDNIELVMGVDYELTYSNNTEPGVATMIVTGIGNYTGQIDTTFVIYLEQSTQVRINGELVQGVPDADNPKQLTFKHDWGTAVVSNAFASVFGSSELTVTATDTTLIRSIYRNENTKVFLATANDKPVKKYNGSYIVPLNGKVMIDVTFAIDSKAVGIRDFVAGELIYSIYDLRGQKIDGGVAADKQEVMDRIRRQPQGLYIIKVNNKTIKVYKDTYR